MRSKNCVSDVQSFLLLKRVKCLINESFTVESTKFLFCLCDCTVDSNVGKGEFLLMPGILHVCRLAHVRSHMSPSMDCLLSL